MEIRLVVNPSASRVTPRSIRSVRDRLAVGHRVETVHTTHRGHATELARDALADSVDAIAVLAGDGTLNEVVDAIADTECALLAVPGGSTNIFCRSIGLPADAPAAAAQLAHALTDGHVEMIGLGGVSADGATWRSFLSHTGIGWDAALVELVERRADLKPRMGHVLFALAGAKTFLGGYDRRSPHLRVRFADGSTIEGGYFALVLNRDPYTYVGRRPFVVEPTPLHRNELTVAVLRSLSVCDFVSVMVEALRGGGLTPSRWLEIRHQSEGITVERLTSMPYQVDGDHLGDAARLEIRRGGRVRAVVPLS